MSLNPLYVIAPSLEEYFVDKTTGLPLAGGIVKFWSDVNRSVPKVAYTLSGSPPNYTYTPLPTTSILSAVGTFQDAGGNNILPYYYPYDTDGNIELYYIEVFASDGTPQFTREGWPNVTGGAENTQPENIPNFIPNGQFWAHNNIPADVVNNIPAGQVRQPITQIAAGGWTYERPASSLATDSVTFSRFGAYVINPTASPRYDCRIDCTGIGIGDSFKDLRVKFEDVNKFSSNTDKYTYSFTASTHNSAPFNVTLSIIKFYGTGGSPSPTEVINLTNFTITSTYTLFQNSFSFGSNAGKSIGSNNDDYVQIAITFPLNTTFGINVTDAMLIAGNVAIIQFPATTNRDFQGRTYVTDLPNYNGFDLGLPLIVGPDGLYPDDSQVGFIYPFIGPVPPPGYLLCRSDTSYRTDAYFSDGVPAARLQRKLQVTLSGNPQGLPLFGTGPQYVNATFFQTASNWYLLAANNTGHQPSPQNGAISANSQFFEVSPGHASYGFNSYVADYTGSTGFISYIWIKNTSVGQVPLGPNTGTSGLLINAIPNPNLGEVIGTGAAAQTILVGISAGPGNGSYFQVSNPTNGDFYVWFQNDGVGTDPAPGGTGIKVNLRSNMDINDIAYSIACAVSGFQLTAIFPPDVSGISPGSYWTFVAPSGQLFYVWQTVDGVGTDPFVPGGLGILVRCVTGALADAVKSTTCRAINAQYYGMPELRGMYLKGWDNSGLLDSNAFLRYAMTRLENSRNSLPHYIGSYQFDMLKNHSHQIPAYLTSPPLPAVNQIDTSTGNPNFPTGPQEIYTPQLILTDSGIYQNDVTNMYVNYIMKY